MPRRPDAPLRRLRSAPAVAATVVTAVVPLTGVLFWRGLGDPFELLKMTVGAGLALVALACWLVGDIRRDRAVLPPASLLAALGAFVLAAVVAVVLSVTPMTSLVGTYTTRGGLLTYGAAVVLLLVGASLFDDDRATAFLVAVTGAAAVVAAYCLLQAAGGDPFTWLRNLKVFGTLGNNDFASGWLGATLPLAVGTALVLDRDDWRRRAAAVVAVAMAVTIPLTKSFQGIPAGLVGIAVVAVAWYQSDPARRMQVAGLMRGSRRTGVAVAGVVVVVGGGILAWAELRHGMVERRYFWRAALHIAGHHPFVGTGLDTFATEFFRARPAGHAITLSASSAEAPHNVFLAMLANGGILLLAAYLAVVVTVGLAFVHGLRHSDGRRRILIASLAGAWLAYQVQSLVSIDMPPLVFLHWVLAGVGVAVSVPERRLVYLGKLATGSSRGRRQREVVREARPAIVVVAVLTLFGLFVVSRPLVADRAAVHAVKVSHSVGGSPLSAIGPLRDAVRTAPWEPVYRLALADLYLAASNPNEAAAAAAKAAELDPGRPSYRLAAGDLYGSLGQPERAIGYYRDAIRLDPHNPSTLDRAGRGLVDNERVGEGIREIRRALELAPTLAQAWFDLGIGLQARDDDAGARKAFDRAVELDPSLQIAVNKALPPT